MLDHHHHFFLVSLMHGRGSDVEFVHQVALVLYNKTHGFTGLDGDFLRDIIVVVHFNGDSARNLGNLTGLSAASPMVTATMNTTGKSACRQRKRYTDDHKF